MNNAKRVNKGFWLTLILSLIIAALVGVAFLPSVISARETTQAVTVGNEVNAEAMRVLGCCNAYVAEHSFKTTMNGAVKAKVLGVPYTQKIHGGRTVDGEKFTDVAESTSALVKAAVKRERHDGAYFVSRGSYKNKSFDYGDARQLTKSEYISQYGQPFTGVVKYNLDNTVIGAKKINDNVYRYVLDSAHATAYTRNEIKTTLGGKSYPEYSRVEVTLTTDGSRPVKVTTTEKFRIDKFGGTDCTAEYTEIFNFN